MNAVREFLAARQDLAFQVVLWTVVGVLGLTALWLFVRAVRTGLLKKELKHYFYSPIAWLVMAGFAFVNGYVFLFFLDFYQRPAATEPFPVVYFTWNIFLWILLLFTVPAITMRLVAEEKATGTLETLMTAPVRDSEVVFAKYLAALVFYVALWVPTLPLMASLYYHGLPDAAWADLAAQRAAQSWSWLRYAREAVARMKDVMDVGPFLAAYFGMFLMGAAWIAIGLLASSFARNQVVAFMSAFVALIMLFAIGFAQNLVTEDPAWFPGFREVVRYLSFYEQYERFPKGVVDSRSVVYFVSFAVVSLFFTVRVVESRKWR